jgi:hypothetical protein
MKALKSTEEPASALHHCLNDLPYRMVVFRKFNGNTPLFQVAGSDAGPMGAMKALQLAHKIHGGDCFYCKKPVATGDLGIDHAEPQKLGGNGSLPNLLVSCKSCNADKGHKPIEAFDPGAGKEWLSALLAQVQDRLNRVEAPSPSL